MDPQENSFPINDPIQNPANSSFESNEYDEIKKPTIIGLIFLFIIDAAQTLFIAVAVFLVIYAFLFRPFQVSGHSMDPTFQDGEYVLTNLIVLRFEKLKLGDVVVFKAPIDAEKDFIKRIVGVPGDTVSLKDGDVYLNHQLFNQSAFLNPGVKSYPGAFLKDRQEVVVPPNEYFVMGDNRPNSSDSREWGFVAKDLIIGKSQLVYFPINEIKVIKNPFK